ncbi:cache domain-containing protein [Cedecea davisae]|uniref:cache domain-containing protein n=1 Tax=Cedecea davisae TaxID=158484 RepID=UPI001D0A7D8D|nr:cache domain-containing protein [Cedecea davisae]
MILPSSLLPFTRKIDDIIKSTIEATVSLAHDIESALGEFRGHDLKLLLDPAVKKMIQGHIKETLNNTVYCSGSGFASHIEASADNKEFWLLEWWYKKADGVNKVNLDLDQATQQRLDFRTFEWFKRAPEHGKAYIHGPYVDYVCNTSYTLTSAMPVYFNQRFIGVAAIDLLVSKVEEELLPLFNNHKVVLTNIDKRIIFSSWPKYRVGDLFNTGDVQPMYQSDYCTLYEV